MKVKAKHLLIELYHSFCLQMGVIEQIMEFLHLLQIFLQRVFASRKHKTKFAILRILFKRLNKNTSKNEQNVTCNEFGKIFT